MLEFVALCMHAWSSRSVVVLPRMTADIMLCEFYMFLKEQFFSQLCSLVENSHKNCLGSLHVQMPLGCPATGHQILLLSVAFFPKRGQSSCSHIAKKNIFSSRKWLHKILSAQKAFLVSAHELLFFLSCRHGSIMLLFFFLMVCSYWVQEKIESDKRKGSSPAWPVIWKVQNWCILPDSATQ